MMSHPWERSEREGPRSIAAALHGCQRPRQVRWLRDPHRQPTPQTMIGCSVPKPMSSGPTVSAAHSRRCTSDRAGRSAVSRGSQSMTVKCSAIPGVTALQPSCPLTRRAPAAPASWSPSSRRQLDAVHSGLGHQLAPSTVRSTAVTISSTWGTTARSSGGLNGIGACRAPTRATGAARSPHSSSFSWAAISAP